MKRLQKTTKVAHCTYRRLGCGPYHSHKFGGHKFQLLEYKNKPRVVIFKDWNCRNFHSAQVISPSEARKLIGWLAKYLAIADPDPISTAIASTKAHAQSIRHEQDTIAKELGL